MDANTAATMKHTVDAAIAQGLPVLVEVGEKLPEVVPLIARNAEGAVQAGKTALNLLKGAGVAFGTGLLFGSGAVLFVAGAGSAFWVANKAKVAIENKMEARRERIAKEEYEAKKTAAMGAATPAPA